MNEITFFVANNGKDHWSGRISEPNKTNTDGPFATIHKAKNAVRDIKKANQANVPISIILRGGTYFLKEPFCLTPDDSGTKNAPITYCSYPGEKPILTGGRQIANWQAVDGGLWQTFLPEVKDNSWFFRQLFVNGTRRSRARIPKEGDFYEVAGALDPDKPVDENYQDYHEEGNENHKGFRFTPGQIKKRENLTDIEVVVLHPFAATRMKIEELDEANGVVRFVGPEYIWSYAPSCFDKKKFYIENIKEGLTEQGTWYLDRNSGMLTYRPMTGEDIYNVEVIAPALQFLIRLEGDPSAKRFVEHVIFSGLTMRHNDWVLPKDGFREPQAAISIPGAIWAEGAINCTFENSEIGQIGTYALEFGRGCQNNRIVRNHLYDMGAGGIKLGEAVNRLDDIDEARNTVVSDNRIHGGGKVFPEGVGIWIGQSSGNHIVHNEINNMHYTGISVGWNWSYSRNRTRDNIIEFNHIHHVMKNKFDDGGAIYTLGVSPGTTIRNNHIHHIYGCNYGYGIYLDEGTMGVLVENNVIHHFSGAGIRLQIATGGNIIMNNIIALGTQSQFGIDTDRTNSYLCNIIYWKEGNLFTRSTWDEFETVFDQNLYFHAMGKKIDFAGRSFEEWKKLRPRTIRYISPDPVDNHSLVADPLFTNPENGDFSLAPNSPALKLGFVPIDIGLSGPRDV